MKKIFKLCIVSLLCLCCVASLFACDPTTTGSNEQDEVTVPAGTQNALVTRYKVNNDNTVTATISVEGDVKFAGITGDLKFDSSVLTYKSHEAVLGGLVVNPGNDIVSFSYATMSDITSAQTLFTVTFSYTAPVNTSLTFDIKEGNFSNAALENVQYTVVGGEITIK